MTEPPTAPAEPPAGQRTPRRACLIVDDSRLVRRIARGILEAQGFTIEEAEDGRQALEACRRAMPHVILLDWNMPVMNGIEFLRALRTEFGDERATVLFCTTENDVTFIMEAIEAGASEYIMKPFDAEILTSKLEQVGML